MHIIRMKAPKGFGGMNIAGMPIKAVGGIAEIPVQYVEDAKSHGFTEYEMSKDEIIAQASDELKAASADVDAAVADVKAAKEALGKAKDADKPAAQAALESAENILNAAKEVEAAKKEALALAKK